MAQLPGVLPTESVDCCPLCASAERSLWNRVPDDLSAVQCAGCGLVYMDRRLTDSALKSFYSGYNESRDAKQPGLLEKRRQMYVADRKFMQLFMARGKLLDIGCGRGDFLAEFGENFEKIGHDIDVAALAEGRNRHPQIAFLNRSSQITEVAPLDAVVFRGTLQYQRDLRHTSALMAQIIKPNGWLFLLQTPNAESPAAVLQRENWGLHNKLEHLYTFSLKTLAALFSDFEIFYFDFPYVGTPYENQPEDLQQFAKVCHDPGTSARFPFWGSMMNVALRRTSK